MVEMSCEEVLRARDNWFEYYGLTVHNSAGSFSRYIEAESLSAMPRGGRPRTYLLTPEQAFKVRLLNSPHYRTLLKARDVREA